MYSVDHHKGHKVLEKAKTKETHNTRTPEVDGERCTLVFQVRGRDCEGAGYEALRAWERWKQRVPIHDLYFSNRQRLGLLWMV